MQCLGVFVANNAKIPSQTSHFIRKTQFLNNQYIALTTIPQTAYSRSEG